MTELCAKDLCEKIQHPNNDISDQFNKIPGEKGQDVISASGYGIFDKNREYRFYLEINNFSNTNNENTLVTIMLNPSKTYPNKKHGFDSTVRNVIRIANKCDYSKVVILNLFARICGNAKESLNQYDDSNEFEKLNREFVTYFINNTENCDYMLAWGENAYKNDSLKTFAEQYQNHLKSKKKPIKYFAWNNNKKCPYHPSQQADNRYKYVRNFLKNDTSLKTIKNQ